MALSDVPLINPTEKDPYNIKPSDPGAKLDSGKPRMDLLKGFDLALIEVAKVLTIGAQKYSENGWKDVPDGYKRYSAAMLRHYFASGDLDDGPGGTGMLHDAQVAWNALARLQFRLEGKK